MIKNKSNINITKRLYCIVCGKELIKKTGPVKYCIECRKKKDIELRKTYKSIAK